MNWTPLLIVAAVVVIVFVMKRAGQISAQDALKHLKNGALVIDVRSPGEFNSGHLAQAINIPATVLANTAYVGFTGGTGGSVATQNILSWTYQVN